MTSFMDAHLLLCSRFVDDAWYRNALQGGRADLSTVARYLAMPTATRPALTPYFDAVFYLDRYPDVAAAGNDPLLHFLQFGIGEMRDPHPLIDLNRIVAQNPALLDRAADGDTLIDLLEDNEIVPGSYFDPAHYRAAVGAGAPAQGLLGHFLREGLGRGIDPNPFLDLGWYIARNSDAPRAPHDALRHFALIGDPQARPPSAQFDSALYWARYPDIAAAKAPPLWHFLGVGRSEGRQAATETRLPVAASRVGAACAIVPAATLDADASLRGRIAAHRQAEKDHLRLTPPRLLVSANPKADLARLQLPAAKTPTLSILVPVFNEAAITVECLLAIVAGGVAVAYEIVVADDASDDKILAGLGKVANLVHVRQATNIGFIANCNAAFAHCRGAYVLLLNNDTQVLPGAIDCMVQALAATADLGAVGPKLIYPTGRLQEAGCFIKPNGESGMVGLFRDPDEPGFGYDRDVTYCSGAALMIRRSAVVGSLFDDAFRPAYCEDADLCLRLLADGHRVRYLHQAVVVHHLSVSTNRGSISRKLRTITRNQQTLATRWADALTAADRVRTLAFYLPQFHPTPENDRWWGRGFTEWTNVAKATASYLGHYQPHLPADLGFYDLRSAEALAAQAALAARYGVEGFCVYYYNFGERRVLTEPLDIVRAHPAIDFHWCLCWANENWTRRWDGGSAEILLEQQYDPVTLAAIIADVVSQAADPRYLRVGDRPLFLVYRPMLLPDAIGFATDCRAAFAQAGFAGVHLVYVESMEAVDRRLRPADIGFDASVEFPPHGRAVPASATAEIVKPDWNGYRYDYPETAHAFITRESAAYPRYPAVFPSWDNTPRQPQRGTSFDAISPDAFRVYVEEKIEEIRNFHVGDARLLFVNAWNEWAEGTHLEPDSGYGHRWLEALRDATYAKRWN